MTGGKSPEKWTTIMRTAVRTILPKAWAFHTTTPATAAIEADPRCGYERALDMMLTQRGDPFAEIEQVLAGDPGCVFAHCVRAALIVRADSAAARPTLAASIAAIEAAYPDTDDPTRRHAVAARAWLDGDPARAAALYDAILIDNPQDVLALAVAHALDFHLGRRRATRDRIARVLPYWSAEVPGYASVLAMYAFALEENGQYRRAEKFARRALAIDPGHPGAIHVVAHVIEMQGRAHDGLAFLAATEPAWRENTGLSVHLAWHRALFQLDTDDPASALTTYDAQIIDAQVSAMSVLADASALLWRLQLRDIEVGDRWQKLADHWQKQALANARPFFLVHAMMAFAAAGRTGAAEQLLEEFSRNQTAGGSSSVPEEALAIPFCEALRAFAGKAYAECVGWLTRVRHIAHRCGGSLAQCDLIHLTFTEAALRARQERLARALVAERTARKPASLLNRLLQRRLGARAGYREKAGQRAVALLA